MAIEIGLFDIMQVDPVDGAGHADVYRRRLDDLALADELGFRFAFTAERHFMPHYRCSSPTAWIGAASQRTRNLRLGVLAYTLPIHNPVLLAEEIATLDHLTGGRLEIGVGLGHRTEELIGLGVDPGQRIPIFQERLAIMEALWTGGRIDIESDHNTVRDVAINPVPCQSPHPPLWYAGVDPGAANWAGSHGMSLAIGFAPSRDLVPAAGAFRAGCAERAQPSDPDSDPDHEDRPGSGRVALMRHTYVADSDGAARAEMTDDLYRLQSLGADAEGSRADRRGSAAAEMERLIAHEIFVAGSPETVANAIARAGGELGATLYLANVYAAGVEDGRVHRTMRLLAGEVRERVDELAAAASRI